MAERQLPSNSHAAKEQQDEQRIREPIAKGHARKRSAIVGNIIAEDARSVRDNVMSDVVYPAIKDILYNTFMSTIEMFLYGESRGRGGYSRGIGGRRGYSDYNSVSKVRRYGEDRPRVTRSRSMTVVEALIPMIDPDTGERNGFRKAQDVAEELLFLQDQYDQVRVADFYELVGMEQEYTDNNWGWCDLSKRDIDIRQLKDDYLITMPRPVAL